MLQYQFGVNDEISIKKSSKKVILDFFYFLRDNNVLFIKKNPTEEKIAQEIEDLQQREKELKMQRNHEISLEKNSIKSREKKEVKFKPENCYPLRKPQVFIDFNILEYF